MPPEIATSGLVPISIQVSDFVEDVGAGEPGTVGGGGDLLPGLIDGAAAEAQAESKRVHPRCGHRGRLGKLIEERSGVYRHRVATVAIQDRCRGFVATSSIASL